MFQTTKQMMMIPNVLDSIIIPYKASTNREFEHCPVAHAVGSKNNCWESWDQQILSTWPITKHGMPLREQCTSLRGPCRAAWGSHIKNATDLVCFQNGPRNLPQLLDFVYFPQALPWKSHHAGAPVFPCQASVRGQAVPCAQRSTSRRIGMAFRCSLAFVSAASEPAGGKNE